MKDAKQRQKHKVVPHCYRRNRSRTLSNSCLSISQLVQIGAYKKRINGLSKNNRHLAGALQEARLEVAVQQNILKDYARDCNNILFARLKLNEMANNLAKFVTDLEEVRNYLNFDLPIDKNPYTHKKGSPNDRISKAPAVNCIQEVSYESSVNEAVSSENTPAEKTLKPAHDSNKKSDIPPDHPGDNIDENMEIAPILFVDDSEGKKKSSTKNRISKKSVDPDKESLTPELNIDVTCVKLKRNSSRRQTQFLFPGSRSTSKGKTSAEKENIFEELMTPVKPESPTFNHQKQEAPVKKQSLEENFESPIIKEILGKERENANKLPENHLTVAHDAKQCVSTHILNSNLVNNSKPAVVLEAQQGESNQTVHLCEDMELTEVIRPVHQIIVANGLPFDDNNSDAIMKKNDVIQFDEETKDRNMNKDNISEKDAQEFSIHNCAITKKPVTLEYSKEIKDKTMKIDTVFKKDTQESCIHPHTSKLPKIDGAQLPKLSESDEVQNVGMITFCEPNDKTVRSNCNKSSVREHRRSKPVKYAVFFSSDDSDDGSFFEVTTVDTKKSKRTTVIPAKSSKMVTENNDDKLSQETENEDKIDDLLKCPIDSEKREKKTEKKSAKKSKDKITSSKSKDDDLLKHLSQKSSIISKDRNLKLKKAENIKKLEPSHKNNLHKYFSEKSLTAVHENIKPDEVVIDEKSKFSHKSDLSKHSSHKSSTLKSKNINLKKDVNAKKSGSTHKDDLPIDSTHKSSTISQDKNNKHIEGVNVKKFQHENDIPKVIAYKSATISKDKNDKLNEDINVKNFGPNHQNFKNQIFSPISSPGILKKTHSKPQTTNEKGSDTLLRRVMFSDSSDDSITKIIESPKSESRRVSFAPVDLVCNFRKMSVSKKIGENKKVRRTSKSVLNFEELPTQEAQPKTSSVAADNFSESTNGQQKANDQYALNFSDDTELYTFKFPYSFLTAPATDDLMPTFNDSSNNAQKNGESSKKHLVVSKPVKNTGKLSLKKHKNDHNGTEPVYVSADVFKEKSILFESPVSVNKTTKRKSLFKENLDEDSKENINYQIPDQVKDVLKETDKAVADMGLDIQSNKIKKSTSSSSQNQRKTKEKRSTKKLSEKKKLEPSSGIKKKKLSVALKSLETSPVLKDTINLPETYDSLPAKRRSRPVCLKEPSLNKKLRRA